MFGAIGALLSCFAYLWADLRIKKRSVRMVLLCVSALTFPLFSTGTLIYLSGGITSHFVGHLTMLNPGWFLIPGLGIFLGLNK